MTAMILGVTDRGLNYSIQQSTWESLYVPLEAEQKYKAKAFIDMFVDRAAKAAAALVLVALIAASGATVARDARDQRGGRGGLGRLRAATRALLEPGRVH